jgi:TAT (twin-arginine translocation) pathway signal sequence
MKERTISRRQIIKLAGAAGAVGLVGAPQVAFAAEGSDQDRMFIGFNLHGTGPSSAAGTFVMSGRFEDSGTSSVENISLVPIDGSDRSRLSGDQQFAGQRGTIFTHFNGVAFPNGDPHAVGEGRITIVSGTGAYSGIHGQGSFLIVVDQISNQFIGTEVGNVER